MGHSITCLSNTVSTGGDLLRFTFCMRGDASPPPVHVHPRQEERLEVVSGSVLSISGGVRRVLGPGGTFSTPPGEPHTVGPAGDGAVEMIVEFRPALGFEGFVERMFALDRRRTSERQRTGQPAASGHREPHEAEFVMPRVPIELQRSIMRAVDRLDRWLHGARG